MQDIIDFLLTYGFVFIPVLIYMTPLLIYTLIQIKKGKLTKKKKIVITILFIISPGIIYLLMYLLIIPYFMLILSIFLNFYT